MTATLKLNGSTKKLVEPVARMWARRKEFMAEVGAEFVKEAQNRIDKTKADPDGRKWRPWAKSTRLARQKDGSAGGGLLKRSGRLRDSIRFNANNDRVEVYTDLDYATYLQNGTGNMPARPFIGIGKNEDRAIKQIWQRWIKQ